ncbi:MAG: indole-3-glycerol-phosphate synthase [Candidatus Bathyarchaeia archaeon]|jgi:indole-3-glycerol phosphate synthase
MSDFLDVLARVAQITIDSEYYDEIKSMDGVCVSLKKSILDCKVNPIITEIKAASPSAGVIRRNVQPSMIAKAMERGGAVALSVLTEPKQFDGSLEALAQARQSVKLPILMKDIVLSPIQIQAASKIGASSVLLIQALFDRGYSEKTVDEMIAGAHMLGLEVLLETHTLSEFVSALQSDADLIGINNRDLATLKVDLNVTKTIIQSINPKNKIVVSESGIKSPSDVHFLRESGASAFLIGSAIMLSDNLEEKVREFVNAK